MSVLQYSPNSGISLLAVQCQQRKTITFVFEELNHHYYLGGRVNIDYNSFDHSDYIYNDPILHHLQWIFEKSTISSLKSTDLQATINNYFASLAYNLQPEFGPNLQSTK